MEMPGSAHFGTALKAAVESGQVPRARLDDMVRRILTQMFRFGLFNRPATGSPSATVTSTAHAALARRVAEQGSVLLRNEHHVLPLRDPRRIAVIGQDAGPHARTAGGGSAHVTAPHVVTPYQAIARRAGGDVTYTPGPTSDGRLPVVPADAFGDGLSTTYYDGTELSGDPIATGTDATVDADFGADPPDGVPATDFSVRWAGTVTAPATGTYTFSLTSDDGSRLLVDGRQVIDNWGDHASRTVTGTVELTAGQAVPVEVDYYQAGGDATVSLGWQPPGAPDPVTRAADAARDADVALVFVGADESEGSDLTGIDLPGRQNELVDAVAAANPDTVVVLNTGSAVTMPWIHDVPGVLEAWYPGQEDGAALAALLFGDVNPSGKLPVTFPRSLADVPAHTAAQWPGTGGTVSYSEGLEVGYRWYDAEGIAPLFAFGHGLSYTTFGFSGLSVRPGAHGSLRVRATVTDTGHRAGADVVQVYVSQPAAAGEPPKALAGYVKVSLRPGHRRRVTITLPARAFQHWDATAHRWVTTPGTYRVALGDASDHLPLHTTVRR